MSRTATNNPETGANTTSETGANTAPEAGANTAPEAGVNAPKAGGADTVNPPEVKKEEYEEVFLPKNGKGDDSLFVSVNGKRILIKKGVLVKVPKAHAEVIRNSLRQTAKNDEFIAKNATE